MKQLLYLFLLILLGGPTHAATYEANRNKTPSEQTITGGDGEGIKVLQSPKPIQKIAASFRCEISCDLSIAIVYNGGLLDRSGQPVGLMVDDVFKEGVSFRRELIIVKGSISIPGSMVEPNSTVEILTFTVAQSIKELKAMSMSKIKAGIGNYDTRTEVEIDARKFDLSRLMHN